MRVHGRTAVASAAAVVLLLLAGCGGGSGTVSGDGYSFTLPQHWQKLATPQGMTAAYKRSDGAALLTIRKVPGSPVITRAFLQTLDQRFHSKLRGYVPLGAKIIDTKAGGVFLLTYTQRKGGRLTTIALVPVRAKGYSWVVDTVENPNSGAASHDIAAIINSFTPTS